MIAHRQIRSELHSDFIIVDGAVEIAGRASRLAPVQVRVRILRIDTKGAIIFSNGSDDVVAAETLNALLDVFFCGFSALGGDCERKCDQETNCE